MIKTKHYVFDCDTDLYKLSQKINKIFKKIKRVNNGSIYLYYLYLETEVGDKCFCNLLPDDTISLAFGCEEINFCARGKVLKIDIDTFKIFDDVDYYMKIEVIDKE